MLRRLALACLALLAASAAQAQFRPGFAPGFRSGFQFALTAPVTATVTWSAALSSNTWTLSNGNLTATKTTAGVGGLKASKALTTGRGYFETTVQAIAGTVRIGVATPAYDVGTAPSTGTVAYTSGGGIFNEGTQTATVASYAAGDVIGVDADRTNATVTFYKNGASVATVTGIPSGDLSPLGYTGAQNTALGFNGGHAAFTGGLPSGSARWDAIGICPNASLAYYDFQANTGCSEGTALASSTSGLTVSRATTGYDLAATTLFAANTARRTSAGLLVEPTATNLVANSKDIGGTGYSASGVTITRPSGTAPDGSTASSLLAYQAGTLAQAYTDITANAGSAYIYCVYQRGASGGEGNNLFIQDNNPYTTRGTASATVTAAWQRYCVTFTAGKASMLMLMGTNSAVTGATQPQTARSIYTTFAQAELGSTPTSYIPTTGSTATRAADTITLSLPTGATKVDLTYDTGTVTVTVSASSYTLPPNPANTNLRALRAYAG